MNGSLELFRGSHWAAPISELIARNSNIFVVISRAGVTLSRLGLAAEKLHLPRKDRPKSRVGQELKRKEPRRNAKARRRALGRDSTHRHHLIRGLLMRRM